MREEVAGCCCIYDITKRYYIYTYDIEEERQTEREREREDWAVK